MMTAVAQPSERFQPESPRAASGRRRAASGTLVRMMSKESACEASALLSAQAVARDHGVDCDEAVPIAAGSNVLVHLKPAPVVARVMTGTALLHDDVEQWLAPEVAVGAFAAEHSASSPPTGPSTARSPPPGRRWMTLWKFVAHDTAAPLPAPSELGRSLRGLHTVLADFPGDLAPLGRDEGRSRVPAGRAASIALADTAGDRIATRGARRPDTRGLRQLAAASGNSR